MMIDHTKPMRPEPDPPRFLSREICAAIVQRLQGRSVERGMEIDADLLSAWRGDVRWGRNRITVASNWRDQTLEFRRRAAGGAYVRLATNQLDASALASVDTWGDRLLQMFQSFGRNLPRPAYTPVTQPYTETHIWSETTYAQHPEQRSTIAGQLIQHAEQAGMLSAGYLSVEARGVSYRTPEGLFLYAPQTLAQCSLTVRDPEGTGSGWAGASSYEWTRFDADKLAAIALDKCLRSRHPVTIEPGRYTLILEPQATFALVAKLVRGFRQRAPFDRLDAEFNQPPQSPFHLSPGQVAAQEGRGSVPYARTKLGQHVVDERITIGYDPADLDLGVIPFTSDGEAYVPVTWIDRGVLTTLAYDRAYAQNRLHEPWGIPNSGAFRMSGGNSTIDEMIKTTKRGLLVTRFWGIDDLDYPSMLATGLTRDGFWLIENGTITKAIKNMRWTESVLFALNNVEELGPPVPVFSPEMPAIVPPMKVRDFSFTALADAI